MIHSRDCTVVMAGVGSRRGAPLTPSRLAQGIAFVVVTVLTVGFGTHRMAPVDPRAVGALNPDIEDPEAGLLGSRLTSNPNHLGTGAGVLALRLPAEA